MLIIIVIEVLSGVLWTEKPDWMTCITIHEPQ
jgi:hypothetical protein